MASNDGIAGIPSAASAASPAPAMASVAEPPGASERPGYHGGAGRIGWIVFGNTLLNIVTLSLYRFWGKTRLRRYLWRSVRLWDDPVIYHGRGLELFVGFLIALAVLIPLGIVHGLLDTAMAGWGLAPRVISGAVFYLFFGFLIGVAIFRARRYRLSRTSWRHIRAGQTGSSALFGLKWLGYTALTVVTLGLVLPVKNMALQRHLMRNTWFGNRPFVFDGSARELMGRWLLCWILAVPTLGLSLLWYSAFQTRCFARFTGYENLRFELPVTFGNLFAIYAPYFLVMALLLGAVGWIFTDAMMQIVPAVQKGVSVNISLGNRLTGAMAGYFGVLFVIGPVLAATMVTHRMIALACNRLVIAGTPDFAAIAQGAHAHPSSGEGLADALDVGGL